MPILEITPEMVGVSRSRLTLSVLENVMLWPDDPAQREVAAAAAQARFLSENVPTSGTIALDAADLRKLLTDVSDAQPLWQVQQNARQPFTRGIIAGLIFLDALQARHTGERRNLQQIKGQIAAKFRGKVHFENLSNSTVENHIWAVYRPVAHFWGAYLRKGLGAIAAGSQSVFPCSVDALPGFLAQSEALRIAGEQCALREGRTLLDPRKTWTIPEGLELPTVGLSWDARGAETSNSN